MITEGKHRTFNRDDITAFIMLLPRAGVTARMVQLFDFLEDNADEGWEWSPYKYSKEKSLEALIASSTYVEKHDDWRLWHVNNRVSSVSFNLRFRAATDSRERNCARFGFGRDETFFPLNEFVSSTLFLGDERSVSPQEFFILEKLIEIFKPYYGFVSTLSSLHTTWDVPLYQFSRRLEKVKQTYFMKSPWSYYARTMFFGPELIGVFKRDKLINAPVYRILNMPNESLLIQGPGGFYDLEPLDVQPIDAWRDEQDILYEYDDNLVTYLGLLTRFRII